MKNQPPKHILKFLRWFCHPDLLPSIEGDLMELYQERVTNQGKRTANWWFAWDVIKLFRPSIIRPTGGAYRINHFGMFKNYVTVAFRLFKKEKSFAFINVMGLALAITCSLMIYLWVEDELRYNNTLEKGDRLYYVLNNGKANDQIFTSWSSSYPLKAVLDENYPFIEKTAITSWPSWISFETNDKIIGKAGAYASSEYYDLMELEFLQGRPEAAKDKLESVALSETMAGLLFGEDWHRKNVVGEIIKSEQGDGYEVTGVYKDMPDHLTYRYDYVIPFDLRIRNEQWLKDWNNSGSLLYIRLKEGISREQAQLGLATAIKDHSDSENETREILLHPFNQSRLYYKFENGKAAGGQIEYVRLLSSAAILMLLLAAINFMNLSTARSLKRAKEAGIRKVLGAHKSNLRLQFLTESVLITSISFLVSIGLLIIALPYFNQLTDKNIVLDFLSSGQIGGIILSVLALGLISGLYPALYLSAMNAIVSLKGGFKHAKYEVFLRKGLVVVQFAITILMIVASLTVYQQVKFLQNRNIGLDRTNLIRSWSHEMDPGRDYQMYKDELMKRPGIESVGMVNQNLLEVSNSTVDVRWNDENKDDSKEFFIVNAMPDFIPAAKLNLLQGRNFSWDLKSDTANYVVNEAAVKLMGLTDPIGQELDVWGVRGKIIGVVQDYHIASAHRAVEPLIIRNWLEGTWMIIARAKESQEMEAVASLKEVYHMFNPKREFWYNFVDEVYNQFYTTEIMMKEVSFWFTVMALVISCLGLFALVAYSAEQRTKEIGIRKVLGASLMNIVSLLSGQFGLLLVLSIVAASPIAYYLLDRWLEGFAYRIELNWGISLLAGAIVSTIAYLIIGNHALRSAFANPVDSLRDE